MDVLFENNTNEEINYKLIEKVISEALRYEGVNDNTEVSVTIVDNEEIRKINNKFRNIDRATDVLSFPMLDYPNKKFFKDFYIDYNFDETFLDGDELVLGDIVLSLERALEQSEEYNHSYKREVSYLVVHSILHLLGYDHMEEDDKAIMRKREEELLGELKISR